MKYQEIPPPSYLKHHVRYFWTLESGGVSATPHIFGPVADGCPGLIFQQSADGIFYQEKKPLPDLLLYGQTTKATTLELTGGVYAIGVCCYPNALKSVFGLNADELTNSCLDLGLLDRTKDFHLAEKLGNTLSLAGKIDIIAAFLFQQINKSSTTTDTVTQYALSQIIASRGSIALKDLQQELQLTERSFERRFKQGVGISPKLFSRICRFQHSLAQLKSNNYTKLSDIAFENDYADQSHYIRAFKEFTGFSPYQYQKKSSEIGTNFMLRNS
ncbi:helix-turn-helix domain-containing protein [Chitinophaga arvensicola]|uniref:Helix-turn-helix domain-containing protein n=1 Tax=Chitinophaga arvensicola TaxID=29529 RepID=A0A1I0QDY2_9BACT|nr:AraC family transcriptional regulator [Chitinophaga arvensicola]SEW25197.1 Helix-turn-helix domain-containing protein [Chitinophaga arvensicola]